MVEEILGSLLSESSKVLRRSEIRELLKLTGKPGIISFAGGLPYPGVFPVEAIKEIVPVVMDREGTKALQYGPTEGDDRLRQFLVEYTKEDEGVTLDIDNFLIVSGSQQALDLIAKLFIDPGDPIIVGLPSYLGALQAFKSYRPEFIGVNVDENGMDPEKVEKALKEYSARKKKIKFIYTVPDFQNPAGVTLSQERREKLLELAYQYETVIVEDTPYRELRYEGDHVKTISSMDDRGHAFSLHTFSKILAPGTRLGWITANKAIMEKLVMAKQSADLCSNPFGQAIVYEFCNRGLLRPHIDKIKELYKHKRDLMMNALEKYMPKEEGVKWTHPEGGLFLWLTLPEKLDAEALFPKAIEKQVAYVVGSAFHYDRSGKNTMRLNFSYPEEEQIDEGIKRLAMLFKEVL